VSSVVIATYCLNEGKLSYFEVIGNPMLLSKLMYDFPLSSKVFDIFIQVVIIHHWGVSPIFAHSNRFLCVVLICIGSFIAHLFVRTHFVLGKIDIG